MPYTVFAFYIKKGKIIWGAWCGLLSDEKVCQKIQKLWDTL